MSLYYSILITLFLLCFFLASSSSSCLMLLLPKGQLRFPGFLPFSSLMLLTLPHLYFLLRPLATLKSTLPIHVFIWMPSRHLSRLRLKQNSLDRNSMYISGTAIFLGSLKHSCHFRSLPVIVSYIQSVTKPHHFTAQHASWSQFTLHFWCYQ